MSDPSFFVPGVKTKAAFASCESTKSPVKSGLRVIDWSAPKSSPIPSVAVSKVINTSPFVEWMVS